MKRIIAVCLASVLPLAGCSNTQGQAQKGQENKEPKQGIVYSNLADEASQKEVTELLTSHGVSKGQVNILMAWAKDFNGRVSAGKLTEGFEPMEETGVKYDGLVVDYKKIEQPEEKNQTIPEKELDTTTDDLLMPELIASEANCRLTSFLLMEP